MQGLARNGFTADQVLSALRGVYGSRRIETRYDLLDDSNALVDNLGNVLSGTITYESLADVKRSGRFVLSEDAPVPVDYLRQRIRPWVRLYIPEEPQSRVNTPSGTYNQAVVKRVHQLLARWKFDASTATDELYPGEDTFPGPDVWPGGGTSPGTTVVTPATASTWTTGTSAQTTNTTHSITLPAGATTAEGILIFLSTNNAALVSTTSTGWTIIGATVSNATNCSQTVLYKPPGTAVSALSVTLSLTQTVSYVGCRIAGAGGAPQLVSANGGSGAMPAPAPLTPTGGSKEYLWLQSLTVDNNPAQAQTITAPSGFTIGATQAGDGTGTNSTHTSVAQQTLTAATMGAGSWTISTLDQWVTWTVAIPPSSVVVDVPTIEPDEVGNQTPLSVGSTATRGERYLIEDNGRALRLESSSTGTAYSTAATFLNGRSRFTMAGWFQSDGIATDQTLLTTTPAGLTIAGVATGKKYTVTLVVNGTTLTATTPVNTWTQDRTFIAVQWESGGALSVYLDGEEAATASSGSVVGTISGQTGITVGSTTFDGVVDDLLFAATVVSEVGLRDLYATGIGLGPNTEDVTQRYVEWSQGVFVLSSPTRQVDDNGVVTRAVDAYDQGVVLQSHLRDAPYYIASGAIVTDAIAELLSNTPGVPLYNVVASSKTLPGQRVWDAGTSHLAILNDLTSSIGYEATWFDEDGIAVVGPYKAPQDTIASYEYAADEVSVLIPGAEQEMDLYRQPNKWVLVVSQPDRAPLVATYTNSDPASPTSTVSRGRVITDYRTETDTVDVTVLQDKVRQLAQEASEMFQHVTFKTAVMPIHGHRDVLTLAYPELGVSGKFTETGWSYDLAAGGAMTHKARQVVLLNGVLS